MSVDFDLVNDGKRAGAEVAQLYVGIPGTAVPQPPKALKGFAKLPLEPGQTKHVHLTLDSRAFSLGREQPWLEDRTRRIQDHDWFVFPGHSPERSARDLLKKEQSSYPHPAAYRRYSCTLSLGSGLSRSP